MAEHSASTHSSPLHTNDAAAEAAHYDRLPPTLSTEKTEQRSQEQDHGYPITTTTTSSVWDSLLPVPVPSTSSSSRAGVSLSQSLRRMFSLAVIAIFALSVVWLAVSSPPPSPPLSDVDMADRTESSVSSWRTDNGKLPLQESQKATESDGDVETMKHNWSQYKFLSTLPASRMPGGGKKAPRRVVMIGDIHGSYKPLQRLLSRVRYDPKRDKIIHVGDILAKGPDSIKVISYMREQHAVGVRGNHDQKVIEWRAWMEEVGTKVGRTSSWEDVVDELDVEMDDRVDVAMSRLEELRHTYPSEWTWKSEHWTIARKLSPEDYNYLVALPLTIDVPSIRTIVVHAGLLARDTTLDAASPHQPLALGGQSADENGHQESAELTILRHVDANRSPWNLLNMRSIKKNGEVTKSSNKGTPWSVFWQADMKRCRPHGWNEVVEEEEGEEVAGESTSDDESIERVEDIERRKNHDEGLPSLSCSPVTVVYGHAASRGLDIKPFSKGLDSGCVYGKQLTALVLGVTSDLRHLKGTTKTRINGEDALLVQVECKKDGF